MDEKWKRIDCLGCYEISDQGRMRRMIDGVVNSLGYRKFLIPYEGGKKRESAHRLVAEYFISETRPILAGLVVDHLNGCRDDNRVSNLRLSTMKENNENIKLVRDALKSDILQELEKWE